MKFQTLENHQVALCCRNSVMICYSASGSFNFCGRKSREKTLWKRKCRNFFQMQFATNWPRTINNSTASPFHSAPLHEALHLHNAVSRRKTALSHQSNAGKSCRLPMKAVLKDAVFQSIPSRLRYIQPYRPTKNSNQNPAVLTHRR